MDLFINPSIEFEKTASEVKLPEDPNQWPMEIQQELYKQVPYISDFDPKIVMDRVDGERAYGFGHVEVMNKTEAPESATPDSLQAAGIQTARIPIIIKEGKLQPLDLLVTSDAKMLPLTEMRLRQAIFRPQMFDITSKTPGDQSMIGQLYPPHRSNFGYGGAGVAFGAEGLGKTGSAKKTAAELTAAGRNHIKEKNFALPEQRKYPIPDAQHAASALGFVKMHGTPAEKSQVYAAVAKKYPELAARSSVQAVQNKAEEKKHASKLVLTNAPSKGRPASEEAETGRLRRQMYPEDTTAKGEWRADFKKKHASILSAILPTINEEDYEKFASRFADKGLRAAYLSNNAATSPVLRKLAAYTGWDSKKVAQGILHSLIPSVMQITKVASGYKVKSASHQLWAPAEEIVDRGRLVKLAGAKIALDADMSGAVTTANGANVDRDLPPDAQPEQIKEFGIWKVQTTEGEELIGHVFPSLLDLDGQAMPVALFTDGAHTAVQADMAGVRVGETAPLFEGPPEGQGIFYKISDGGEAVGTIPLTIQSKLGGDEGEYMLAQTFEGRPVKITQQPGIEIPTMAGDTCVIPIDWSWLPLGDSKSVQITEHAEDTGILAAGRKEACAVTIRSGGPNTYSLSGMPVEKLGYDQTQFLSFDDAVFLLSGMGVAPAYAQEKLACALTWQQPVQCRIGRVIETLQDNVNYAATKTAETLAGYVNLRRDLVKEAAAIPDPSAVDTVLSLGFINPENINIFIAGLPTIDETQQKMCELLLAARMGLPNLSASALEKAVKTTEEVYEGLKTLAFSGAQ